MKPRKTPRQRQPYKPKQWTDCQHCGIRFGFYAACTRGTYCSRKCQAEWQWENVTRPSIIAGTLSRHSKGSYRRFLDERDGRHCSICKGTEWQGRGMPLEVDHISGDNKDWRGVNLRYLCPNCHSQQPTSYVNKRFSVSC